MSLSQQLGEKMNEVKCELTLKNHKETTDNCAVLDQFEASKSCTPIPVSQNDSIGSMKSWVTSLSFENDGDSIHSDDGSNELDQDSFVFNWADASFSDPNDCPNIGEKSNVEKTSQSHLHSVPLLHTTTDDDRTQSNQTVSLNLCEQLRVYDDTALEMKAQRTKGSTWPRRSRNNSSSSDQDADKQTIDNFEQSDVDSDHLDKVKNKLASMWNNMKYGWTVKTKTNFRYDSPIWLLGNCYHKTLDGDEMITFPGSNEHRARSHSNVAGFSQFKAVFFSKFWFTYRREFPSLAGSSLTTDCGWGCMLRSGQMMLAQAFQRHFLGRQWNWHSHQTIYMNKMHRNILRWFGDIPSVESPFSIHQLVSLGEVSGKKAGDWYGPASVAHLFKQAMEIAHASNPMTQELRIYVAQDCTIYKQDILELCCSTHSNKWYGVNILVPVRLGGEKLNPIYIPCLRALLAHENCVGIIGGRPRHSLFFIGWQEDSLIYLDPHYCQPVVDVAREDFPVQVNDISRLPDQGRKLLAPSMMTQCCNSFHCMSPRKMSINKMDPSCTIGFHCKTENDLMFFMSTIKDILVPPQQKVDYPIFIIAEGSSSEAMATNETMPERLLKVTHRYVDNDGKTERVIESEDFVII